MSIINKHSEIYYNNKINEIRDSFLKLSKIINKINGEHIFEESINVNVIFEEVTNKMCKFCRNSSFCWEEAFEETYDSINYMISRSYEKGKVTFEEMPISFDNNCIASKEFLWEINKEIELTNTNINWSNKLRENQNIIADQLEEASNVMTQVYKSINKEAVLLDINKPEIIKQFKKHGIIVNGIIFSENSNKGRELRLYAYCKRGCIRTKEGASILSKILKVKMVASDTSKTVISNSIQEYTFHEDTKFNILTGMARGIKDKVSGDNFSIMKLSAGESLIILSDGMGTGQAAFKESDMAISLLEQFLEAGFNIISSLRLINSSLVLRSKEESFTTIDLSLINLYTGVCEFIKVGAVATFIKRNKTVILVNSNTMPIGIIKDVDFDIKREKLYDGDIIIMITDGVLDNIVGANKEDIVRDIIMDIDSNNPNEISNNILERILINSNYSIIDDMTIITSVIWANNI